MTAVDRESRIVGDPNDPAMLRQVFGAFPTGVTALAALHGGGPVGLAASSFNTVSLTPPLVSVCIGRSSTTWPLLRTRPRLGVSVLGAHHGAACRQLSARGVDRFAGLGWSATDRGAVLLDEVSAWFECSIEREIGLGDHDLVLLRVHGLQLAADVPPLVFHGSRFRRLDPDEGPST